MAGIMVHHRRTLKMYDRVCRTDDPKHVGIVMGMFVWERYGEWIANVQWTETRWFEYVPMCDLDLAEANEGTLRWPANTKKCD